MDKIQKIKELVELLNEANHEYYVLNVPKLMSDYEFDMKLKELEDLEKETGYILPYSPTQRVGSDLQDGFKEVQRKRIMGSIANCYDRNELKSWLEKFGDAVVIVEPKYDGSSCSIIYKNGIFTQASTRGSGYSGSDITLNVKTIGNVPLKLSFDNNLPIPEQIEVRGEVLLPKSELKRINSEREAQGLEPFANERNAAAGSLKQLDPSVTASRKLIFKPYGVYSESLTFTENFLGTQKDMLDMACSFGFGKPYYRLFRANDYGSIDAFLDEFENKYLKTQDFCMDGCVIKINNFSKQEELGYTQKVPHWAKAFKFKQEQQSTKLKGIILQMGMSGQLGFVADLEPIEIDGTVVSRATLNNIDFIRELDIQINDYVYVTKGGAVIPGITGVDYERTLRENCDVKPFEEPHVCPFCGNSLSRKIAGGAHLYCTNPECEERCIQKLNHFVKKECMDIDGLSEKTLRKLFEAGVVRNWKDLVLCEKIDLYSAGLGPKVSEKIVDNIKKSLDELGPERTLASLGIPMIGKVSAQKIVNQYGNLSAVWEAFSRGDLRVSGIGDVANDCFVKYIDNNVDEFLDAIEFLPNKKKETLGDGKESDSLVGLKILATGNFRNFSREGIKKSVAANGGTYASGVSGKLDILIVGSDAGPSKLSKAKELGIRMISEDEYIRMIGGIVVQQEDKTNNTEKSIEPTDISVSLF